MKTKNILGVAALCIFLWFSISACAVVVNPPEGGKHPSWIKNPNFPHPPQKSDNGKHKGHWKK